MTRSSTSIRRLRPWLLAATVSAAVIMPVDTATATWHTASTTLIEYQHVCLDGVRFGGAVRDGAGPATGAYASRAILVSPPPPTWRDWTPGEHVVLDSPISIPRRPGTLATAEEEAVTVSHQGTLTRPYRKALPPGVLAALNLEGGSPDTSLLTAPVTDCRLYAAIDVQPGSSTNKVPVGRGQVSVAVLGSATLPANVLTPSAFRFGPRGAAANRHHLADVNRDAHLDLVLRFSSKGAGLKCSTRTALLTGNTATGGIYEGRDKVKPTGC